MDTVPLLRRLSEVSGVSGYEEQVRETVRDLFNPYADDVQTDTLGNVIALKRGCGPETRPAAMIATHMDEIGLIVSDLEGEFLRFQEVGGFDDRVLLGQQVVVHGRTDLPGIIGTRPPHVLSMAEREKPIPQDKLVIDVGLTADQLAAAVCVGDLVTMHGELVELKGGLAAGKALDNRVSVAAAVICLKELARIRHEWDIYAVATVQEEVGCKGAVVSTFGLEPDIGIVVDVTWAKQPGVSDEFTFELGEGPAISCGPNFHPKLHQALIATAQALEIKCHVEALPRPGGTDAYVMQVSREGIPTAQVSIALRNMHTPVETVSIKDVERTGRLLAAFVGRLDGTILDALVWDLGLDGDE